MTEFQGKKKEQKKESSHHNRISFQKHTDAQPSREFQKWSEGSIF